MNFIKAYKNFMMDMMGMEMQMQSKIGRAHV